MDEDLIRLHVKSVFRRTGHDDFVWVEDEYSQILHNLQTDAKGVIVSETVTANAGPKAQHCNRRQIAARVLGNAEMIEPFLYSKKQKLSIGQHIMSRIRAVDNWFGAPHLTSTRRNRIVVAQRARPNGCAAWS
eukprot:TRINITY_DN11229_c0_g1_i10.p1 TRINITY_DN11229_c0_g1~~TRINITY_DN11229_c0_g1_i10.p1  ORF type:complete len:133 (-),score=0.85 TRINITY_DN11229_c0_g1_i10:647-1045(-)